MHRLIVSFLLAVVGSGFFVFNIAVAFKPSNSPQDLESCDLNSCPTPPTTVEPQDIDSASEQFWANVSGDDLANNSGCPISNETCTSDFWLQKAGKQIPSDLIPGVQNPSDLIMNEQKPSDLNSGIIRPQDLDQNNAPDDVGTSERLSTMYYIANDLKSVPSDVLKGYKLTDFTDDEIQGALGILDPQSLSKVFLNLSIDELRVIKSRLGEESFASLVSNIPEPQHSQVLQRIKD